MVFGFKKHPEKDPKKDCPKDPAAPSGPDPRKILELLNTHPAFQVLTVDELKWIDPHSLNTVDCPFGHTQVALEWLMRTQPWHTHDCRTVKAVRIRRWFLHIRESIDFDSRWRLFTNDGHWINPFNKKLETHICAPHQQISNDTHALMARCLVRYNDTELQDLLPLGDLNVFLTQCNGTDTDTNTDTEYMIRDTKSLAANATDTPAHHNKHPSEPSPALTPKHTDPHHDHTFLPSPPPMNPHGETQATDTLAAALAPTQDTLITDPERTIDIHSFDTTPDSDPTHTQENFAPAPTTENLIAGYKITGFLGKGGMGDVHRAIQLSMRREVALKILPTSVCRDDTFSTRFIREARAAGKVNHANVITCFDVGNDHGTLYMALELVNGGDLSQLMKSKGGTLSTKRSLRIITDCTRGLGAIYKAGMIHRDIKPANIFLSEDGIAKLADLGLARNATNSTQVTQAGTCVGTPAYMSPEQVAGKSDIDIRSDIYALGITLYTTLCGHNPFQAPDVWALFRKIMQDPHPDIRTHTPHIHPDIANIINTCLEKNPDNRYQTPYGLLDALDNI